MRTGGSTRKIGSVCSVRQFGMPKEPRRVPTVLGRVHRRIAPRPSGSVLHFMHARTSVPQFLLVPLPISAIPLALPLTSASSSHPFRPRSDPDLWRFDGAGAVDGADRLS